MKKSIVFLLLAQLITLSYAKQVKMGYTDVGIEIEYDFSDVAMSPNPSDSTTMVFSIPGFAMTLGEGLPGVPFKSEKFEVPSGVTLGDLQIQETLEVINAKCAPAESYRSDKIDNQSTQTPNVISSYTGIWPVASAVINKPAEYRDRTIGSLDQTVVHRYDMYGNKMESAGCNNGSCTLSAAPGISIITVEENGVTVDQTKIQN